MKKFFLFFLLLTSSILSRAQCDSVIIEKVYIEEDESFYLNTVRYSSTGKITSIEQATQDYYTTWHVYTLAEYSYDTNDSLLRFQSSNFYSHSSYFEVRNFNGLGQLISSAAFDSSFGSPAILRNTDTLFYDIQNRLTEHRFYGGYSYKILYFYDLNNYDTLQLIQTTAGGDSLKNIRSFDGFGNLSADSTYSFNNPGWSLKIFNTYFYNGDQTLDSLLSGSPTLNTKYEYDYYPNNLVFHKYVLNLDTVWLYSSQTTYYYDQFGNTTHSPNRAASYDSLGNVTFDFLPDPEGQFSYDVYGNLVSYSGHGNPGGPYYGSYQYTTEGAPLSGYNFYSTMGGITTTEHLYWYYADIMGDSVYCGASSSHLSLDSCAGNTYLWSNGATTPGIDVGPGVYSATITHANGYSVQTPEINVHSISALPHLPSGADSTHILCYNHSLILGTPAQQGVSYQWYRNDSLLSGKENPAYYGPAIPGDYYIVASNVCGSDTSAHTQVVIRPQIPFPVITSETGVFTACMGDTLTLFSSHADAYEWHPNNETDSSIQVSNSGSYIVIVFDSVGCSTSNSVYVTFYNTPASSLTIYNGQLQILPANVQFIQYLLNGDTIQGATLASYSPLLAGWYSVLMMNGNDCLDTSNSLYIDPSQLNIEAGPDLQICINGSGTLGIYNAIIGGIPPYTYSWSPQVDNSWSNGFASISNIHQNQVYHLTVTDSLGNTATDSLTVFVNNPEPLSLTYADSHCLGYGVAVTINQSNHPTFSKWILNGDTIQFSSSTYYLTNTSTIQAIGYDQHGCLVSSTEDTIVFYPVTPLSLHAEMDSSSCITGNGTYWVESVPGASYRWDLGSTVINTDTIVTVNYPDHYYVYQTDSNGCVVSQLFGTDLFDGVLLFSITRINTYNCDSMALSVPAYDSAVYLWQRDGISLPDSGNEIIANMGGQYSCTITLPDGCSGIASSYFFPTTPAPVNISFDGTALNYTGTVTNNISFQWYYNGQPILYAVQSSLTLTSPGDYSLRALTQNSCYSYSSVFHYQQCNLSIQTISGMTCNSSCDGILSASALGVSPIYYLWSTGDTTSSITGLCPGNYALTITDSTGCIASSNVVVNNDSVQFIATISHTTCIGCQNGTLSLTNSSGIAPFTYTLNPGNIVQSSPNFTNLPAGVYQVCIADSFGCSICSTDTIEEDPNTISSSNGTEIYVTPNPAHSTLIVHVPAECVGEHFTIHDLSGRILRRGVFIQTRTTLSLENILPGIYDLKDEKGRHRHFVVE